MRRLLRGRVTVCGRDAHMVLLGGRLRCRPVPGAGDARVGKRFHRCPPSKSTAITGYQKR